MTKWNYKLILFCLLFVWSLFFTLSVHQKIKSQNLLAKIVELKKKIEGYHSENSQLKYQFYKEESFYGQTLKQQVKNYKKIKINHIPIVRFNHVKKKFLQSQSNH